MSDSLDPMTAALVHVGQDSNWLTDVMATADGRVLLVQGGLVIGEVEGVGQVLMFAEPQPVDQFQWRAVA